VADNAITHHVDNSTHRWRTRSEAVITRRHIPIVGRTLFSDSEWVIVTDISFDQGDKVANELKLWLTEKNKITNTRQLQL
jgi:hypothetical protein